MIHDAMCPPDDLAPAQDMPPVDASAAREVALAEFNALRAEITNRLTTTATLVGVGLTAVGTIVGFVVKEHGDQRLLLIVPPVAVVVNFLWAVENHQVGLIGQYIRTRLWPYLSKADTRLPSWEAECAERRRGLSNLLRSIVTDYVITLVLAGAALGSVVIANSVKVAGQETKVNLGLRVFDWVLTALAFGVPFVMTLGNSRRTKDNLPGGANS